MTTQTRSVEWLLASLMVAWGFGLMLPGETMALSPYRYLVALAPEPAWAAWAVALGAIRLVALTVNGSYFRTPLIRAICAGLGVVWWLAVGFLLFMALSDHQPLPAALFWYPVFVVFEGYSVYRGAQDSYHSGALRKWRPHRA